MLGSKPFLPLGALLYVNVGQIYSVRAMDSQVGNLAGTQVRPSHGPATQAC